MKQKLKNKDFSNNRLISKEPLSIGFLRSVLEFPDRQAMFINNQYYTYIEFLNIVYYVFKQLPDEKKEKNIGIYCNDDIFTYASIVAINLYGAAYVPLNANFPEARNRNIIKQCDLKLILTSNYFPNKNSEGTVLLDISLEKSKEEIVFDKHWILNFTESNYIDHSIAYILFTSGSTGEPKGVPVSNSNLNHFFNFFLNNYDFNEKDKFLQVYELTFDVSVFSFFMPLIVGACCYVLPTNQIKYSNIIQQIKEHEITVVSMVPTVLRFLEKYLKDISLPSLRLSLFSGDVLYHSLAVKWSHAIPNAEIHNFYGPTETTIVCTRYIWNESESETESVNDIVPLGKAFDGMEILIVNENNLQYEKGELCFYGEQVISSYLNNANEDKFFIYQGKRYYKTGDIVSVDNKGNLLFYGRNDDQVKINGYRIELKEIEFVIEQQIHFNVKVICVSDDKKINSLVAFIETNKLDVEDLKEKLSILLPNYMIPRKFILLESFPLNINGKVDKNVLLNLYQDA